MSEKSANLRKLTESAILVAIATILSVFPKFSIWENGGSVTLCSMLPIIIIAYRHGIKWGLLSALTFSILQIILGPYFPPVNEFSSFILCLFLDYVIAFGVLGLGGIFKKRIKNTSTALIAGSALTLTLRFISHFLSGAIVWGSLVDIGSWQYSLFYNGSYMLPEFAITCVGAGIVGTALQNVLNKNISNNQ